MRSEQVARWTGAGGEVPMQATRRFGRLVSLVALNCSLFLTGAAGQDSTLPQIVQGGLTAYRSGGADSAVHTWLRNSPLAHDSSALRSALALHEIEQAYGMMVGHETLKVVPIGSRVLRIYLVILYQRAPLYVWFECYESSAQWLVSSFLFNARAEAIFPPGLLDR